ncbi:type III PLP-dependent enzyme [Bacillus thuringiensis]|uniref:type III PLP-dependent enzyme n=1 Tax=Bacillus thuringiensis TaxID=1428 RepID=UPI0011A717FF|nr:type III PLP-dependent enzyme [Bacillus thuringiensis]
MNIKNEIIKKMVKKHGSPLYVYSGIELYNTYMNFKALVNDQIDIFLSLKANNNVSIAKLFRIWGSGIEVASLGELNLALKAGFSKKDIIFSGPGKNRIALEAAIDNRIYCIIVESLEELNTIGDIARKKHIKVNIGIRINPNTDLTKTGIKMGGVPRQFGIDESQIPLAIETLKKNKLLNFLGIHIYSGTQIFDENQILASFKYTIEIAKELFFKHNLLCEMIDLGGGFGVPYFSRQQPINIKYIIENLNITIEALDSVFKNTRFIIESGRYLLAKSGLYVTSALYSKISKGEKFVVTDGGMNHHASSTFRGRFIRDNFPVYIIKKQPERDFRKEKVNIVGPLCTPEDCLFKNIELPTIEVDDLICIENSGAYGLSFSPMNFLGHETPAEILITSKQEYLIRNRGNISDLLLNQNIINPGDDPVVRKSSRL